MTTAPALPRNWTLCGWRMIGELQWRPNGHIDPTTALVEEAMGRAVTRPKTAGGKETLEVKAR